MTDKNLRETLSWIILCAPHHIDQDDIDRIKAAIAKDQEEKNKTKT